MTRFIIALAMLLLSCHAQAAVLVSSPSGALVAKPNLTAAITAPDAAGKKIIITSAYTLTGNLTWPADRPLEIAPGGSINRGGYVLTIPGDFTAGRYQVFTGSGSTKFTDATSWASASQKSNTRTVYPEWFPGSVQEAAYSIAAQTASTTSPTYLGGRVLLAPKYHALTTTLVVPDHVWIEGEGGGMRQAALQATGSWTATNPVVQLGRVLGTQYASHDSRIRNCTVDANFKANIGIYSASVNKETGVKNCMVSNFLLKGIHYEDIFAGSTSPRIIHSFIREAQVFAPIAQYPSLYPTPSSVRGIEISAKIGTAILRTNPGTFTSFEVSKSTVSFAAGQTGVNAVYDSATTYSAGALVTYGGISYRSLQASNTGNNPLSAATFWEPLTAGAGFFINGVAGVNISDSHAEYCNTDVVLGDNYPVRNIRVVNFDGYTFDPTTISIGSSTSTETLLLENIYNNQTTPSGAYNAGTTYVAGAQVYSGSGVYYSLQGGNVGHAPETSPTWWSYAGVYPVVTVKDNRASWNASVTDKFLLRYSEGKNYLIGNAASSSSHLAARSRSGTYTAPAGTAFLVEATAANNTGKMVIAGGAGSSTHAVLVMDVEGGSPIDALQYYNGELLIDNGYAGRKVGVPATASTTCKQGQWAADVNYHYDCVSTNTWRRVGISTW